MKVTKFVTMESEVEVHIGIEDIIEAIAEDPTCIHSINRGFNNTLMFYKAIPDELLKQVSVPARKIILEHLDAMATRIKSAPEC